MILNNLKRALSNQLHSESRNNRVSDNNIHGENGNETTGNDKEQHTMDQRSFGKTGETFGILSFGSQRIVDEHRCSQEEAVRMIDYALDHGIRYFDTAWLYSRGQSEERIGLVAQRRRHEMWIATKALARDRRGARRQLETSLRRLRTDHVDEWRFHAVSSMEELDRVMGPDGALEAAIEARDQGLVRFISISGHADPRVQIEAIRRFPFDSVLCATSVLDHFMCSFAEEFLPIANEKGIATIGMKVFGLGALATLYEPALRYSLALPVSTTIVGMESMDQLQKNLAVAEHFKPLSDEERLDLYQKVLPLVTPGNMPWKAAEWGNPEGWNQRGKPC